LATAEELKLPSLPDYPEVRKIIISAKYLAKLALIQINFFPWQAALGAYINQTQENRQYFAAFSNIREENSTVGSTVLRTASASLYGSYSLQRTLRDNTAGQASLIIKDPVIGTSRSSSAP
jgi:hypothetical protein